MDVYNLGFLTSMISDDDKRIITDYLNGDEDAFRKIDSWIARTVGSRAWGWDVPTADMVQDSWLRVHRKLSDGAFKGRSSLRCYVSKIAANTCMDWFRQKYNTPSTVDIAGLTKTPRGKNDPLEDLLDAQNEDLKSRVVDALMRLASPECRDIWRMVYFERLNYKDIAGLLGMREGTVKSRMWRCKDKVKSALRTVARVLSLEITENLEL